MAACLPGTGVSSVFLCSDAAKQNDGCVSCLRMKTTPVSCSLSDAEEDEVLQGRIFSLECYTSCIQ